MHEIDGWTMTIDGDRCIARRGDRVVVAVGEDGLGNDERGRQTLMYRALWVAARNDGDAPKAAYYRAILEQMRGPQAAMD